MDENTDEKGCSAWSPVDEVDERGVGWVKLIDDTVVTINLLKY